MFDSGNFDLGADGDAENASVVRISSILNTVILYPETHFHWIRLRKFADLQVLIFQESKIVA
jgi:hypothetical protein